jgi:predicted amidohydrolase
MAGRRSVVLVLAALAALCGPAALPAGEPPRELRLAVGGQPAELRVAAVQLRIQPADLASREAFRAHITALVERCLPYVPDLILFPEYTSAFLALLPYGGLIREAGSVEQALRLVLEREPLDGGLRGLFLLNSGLAERESRELFGGLARKYAVAVGAGSRFAAESSAGRTVLVNRAVIFDERGGELYAQDKVFLTPFEQDLLGLAPGRLEAARPFLVRGRRLALTLCRDTFFAEWESVLSGAELWVDFKANGEQFTAQAREGFQRALPARLPGAGVPYGLTLCLTGNLAGLAWEGESSVVRWQPGGEPTVLARTGTATGEDLLFFTLPAPEAEAAAEGGALCLPAAAGGAALSVPSR